MSERRVVVAARRLGVATLLGVAARRRVVPALLVHLGGRPGLRRREKRKASEMISPMMPAIIRIPPMSGTFTWEGDQLMAYRKMAPIAMSATLPPIVMDNNLLSH